MIGETIKDFKITRRLGAGGFGEVWAAEQQIIKTRVAIKLLRAEISTDRQHVQRLFSEAIAASKIKHAGIVKIFDVGFHAGRAFLIMEFLEGETLLSRIARAGRLLAGDVAEIGRQIASILEATHAEGIVHRDFKPDNVFLVPDAELASKERVKILDFGFAKLGMGLTVTGETMGSPAYIAPEQWDHASRVDGRADVYSLGCVAFQMCCGQTPFDAETIGQWYAKHRDAPPPRASSLVPGLSRATSRNGPWACGARTCPARTSQTCSGGGRRPARSADYHSQSRRRPPSSPTRWHSATVCAPQVPVSRRPARSSRTWAFAASGRSIDDGRQPLTRSLSPALRSGSLHRGSRGVP